MQTERSPAPSLVERARALLRAKVSVAEIAAYLNMDEQDVVSASRPHVDIPVVVDGGAYLPQYGSAEAAGIDLRAKEAGSIIQNERLLVNTGLSMQLPPGTCGLICPRSGLALKHGITVLNAPGIIDSDYRGDVGIILMNLGREAFRWNAGDRLAQLLIVSHIRASIVAADSLGQTDRGVGGFGSTGVSS